MTPNQLKRLKLKKLKEQSIKPHRKISNTFIQSAIHKNTAGALKTIFYLASLLESDNIDFNQDINTLKIDLRKMLLYTGLTAKDIRNNLKAMQETSISFVNEELEEELMINLLPYVDYKWGKNFIELKIFTKISKLIIDVKNNYTFIDTSVLMKLKNKHSLRLLPVLNLISGYDKDIPKRKSFELYELNDLFGTSYKRLQDVARYVLSPAKEDLDSNSKLSFIFETNFDNFGKGRPKATSITIDLIQKKSVQGKLI
jgi:plasmid replication initiation protein